MCTSDPFCRTLAFIDIARALVNIALTLVDGTLALIDVALGLVDVTLALAVTLPTMANSISPLYYIYSEARQ